MRKHKAWQIKAANGRKRMRVSGKSIDSLTARDLGFHAITSTAPRLQIALIAELVGRLDPTQVVPMLKSLPTEDKHQNAKPNVRDKRIEIGATDPEEIGESESAVRTDGLSSVDRQ